MPDRFARTFGASAILVAIVVIGFIQFTNGDEPTDVDIVAGETSTTAGLKPTTSADVSNPAPEPFVYRIGILQGPSTENFWEYTANASSVWDTYVLAPTKSSLYRVDPATLELEPELAVELTSPRWDASGWWVEVDLRRDLRWSDGEPMTAYDYTFTYETVRRLDLGGNWASAFPGEIESIAAIDEDTVLVRFDGRPGLETWPYAAGTAPIMARHHWEEAVAASESSLDLYAIAGSEDVAGGPLDVVEVGSDRVVSVANNGYPGQAPDTVEYLIFADESTMATALQAGTIHSALTPKGMTAENASLLETTAGVRTITTRSYGLRYLGFNLDRAPMSTLEFREAVAYLLDREGMASEFTPDSDPAYTLMPPANDLWFDADRSAGIQSLRSGSPAERFESALEGLRGAGYTWATEPAVIDGVIQPGSGLQIGGVAPAPLTILTPGDVYDPARARYAEGLAATIELLGFSVIPVETDFSTVVDLAFTRDENGDRQYDMVLLGWSLGNPAYPEFYSEFFGAEGAANNTGYQNDEMERLIEAMHRSRTIEDTRQIIWEIESLIARDLPYLPLYSARIIEAYRSDMVSIDVDEVLGGIHSSLGAFDSVTPLG